MKRISVTFSFAFSHIVPILRAQFFVFTFLIFTIMKTAMQARPGTVLRINGELLLVVKHEMRRGGRGATNVMMRLKNLIQGNNSDRVMDSEEKYEDVTLERSKAEFLYQSGEDFAFMNQDTYETVELHADDVGDAALYLKEGTIVDLQTFEGKFIGIMLPLRVTLLVTEAEPSVAGNTADGKIDKLVKLETGLELRVPGFVNQDESIVINTETGEYLERAK
jgi:elongation factor P